MIFRWRCLHKAAIPLSYSPNDLIAYLCLCLCLFDYDTTGSMYDMERRETKVDLVFAGQSQYRRHFYPCTPCLQLDWVLDTSIDKCFRLQDLVINEDLVNSAATA
jgi:hypothetical protein